MASDRRQHAALTLGALALLYVAQGVPFGFAAEYLPVALRQAKYTVSQIALVGLLQFPWWLKPLWAHVADRPDVRRTSRRLLFGLQMLLTVTLAFYVIGTVEEVPIVWFVLTFIAAVFASTQDIFVDALAVRALAIEHRGFGNTAQVAGYRLGMLAGGAGLLVLVKPIGYRASVLACAALVFVASAAAFVIRESAGDEPAPSTLSDRAHKAEVIRLLKHMFSRGIWQAIVLAIFFKFGVHMMTVLIKPMVVDAKWTPHEIGVAVVTMGTTAGLIGATAGGGAHRWFGERRALVAAALFQAAVCIPLIIAHRLGMPKMWTTIAIATETFASGLGTTILFASLMTATRKGDAAMHYTMLTSANVLGIFSGNYVGARIADKLGKEPALVASAIMCLVPLYLLADWDGIAKRSSGNIAKRDPLVPLP